MKNLYLCFALIFSLSSSFAQETYMLTQFREYPSNTLEPYLNNVYKYDLNTGEPTLFLSLKKNRFELPDVNSFIDIMSFCFDSSQEHILFLNREGEIYTYHIASDKMELLLDVSPENTDELWNGLNRTSKINVINDSLYYIGGLRKGIYNAKQNKFITKMQISNLSELGELITFKSSYSKATWYKGDLIYINGIGDLCKLNLENPKDTTTIIDLYNEGETIFSSLFTRMESCDSLELLILYEQELEKKIILQRIHIPDPNFETLNTFSSQWLEDISPYHLIMDVVHFNPIEWEDCQLTLDLDEDNSTTQGLDFYLDSICSLDKIPIADIDISVRNTDVIDSVVITSSNSYPLSFPLGNYLLSQDNNVYVLKNNGSTTNDEFEQAIKGASFSYAPSGDPSFTIAFVPWFEGKSGDSAIASYTFETTLPNAGVNGNFAWCDGEVIELPDCIDDDADANGSFLNSDFTSITELPDFEDAFTLFYTVQTENCADTATINLTKYPVPDITDISDRNVCFGDSVLVEVSTDNHSFSWFDQMTSNPRWFYQGGTYSYSLISQDQCVSSDTFTIAFSNKPFVESEIIKICKGDTVFIHDKPYVSPISFIDTLMNTKGCDSLFYVKEVQFFPTDNINLEGVLGFCPDDSSTLKVTSNHQDLVLNDDMTSEQFTVAETGEYKLVGTNQYGCVDTFEFSINLFPAASVEYEDLLLNPGEDYQFSPTYSNNVVQYKWTPMQNLDCYDCPNPQLLTQQSGEYNIVVTNDEGCKDSTTFVVRFNESNYYVPNTISSHSYSSENQAFFMMGKGNIFYSISIFDRWGNRIFHNPYAQLNNPNDGWNPHNNFNGGVFTYLIKVADSSDILSGTVTLVK